MLKKDFSEKVKKYLFEIYSNDFMNNGGWKILYVIVITLLLVIFVFSKFHLKKNVIIMSFLYKSMF